MGAKIDLIKSVLIPLLVAAALYVLLSFVLLPLYRRYRSDISRYSQYAPLTSTLQSTTSIFGDYIPEALRPRSIKERLGDLFVRFVLPSTWAARQSSASGQRRGSASSDGDAGLFDEESGERMVGFDMNQDRRMAGSRSPSGFGVRDAGESNAIAAAGGRRMPRPRDESSTQRLNRELESGFVDDSDSELSDEQVTMGRRRLSMSASR